jgi:hypothetical protein
MIPGFSSNFQPPARELLVLRGGPLEADDDGRKRSVVFSPSGDDGRKRSLVISKSDGDGRKLSVDSWTAVQEGEEEAVQAPHHAKLAPYKTVAHLFKQMESNSKVLEVLLRSPAFYPTLLGGILPC